MKIPVIDFSIYNEDDVDSIANLAKQIELALAEVGFISFRHLGISDALLQQTFDASQDFFALSQTTKQKIAYVDAAANFGYQSMQQEKLTPTGLPDLKESLTMRDILNNPHAPWPSEQLKHVLFEFYQSAMVAAYRIQRVFAHILKVEREFFVSRHKGQCTTLRLLRYPPVKAHLANQFGAGEHTDYGMMTLLFQDSVGGLEVQDDTGEWHAVTPVKGDVVLNCGDLMQQWTNDYFRSTKHRVQPNMNNRDRYSIALFIDPDADVLVESLPSCVSPERPAKYFQTFAGEFIQAKIRATHM